MKKRYKRVDRDKSGKFVKGRKGEINSGTFKKGHKGYLDHPNKTSFKKGNKPRNPIKKGEHVSLKTEFKKGSKPWNKGKKLPQFSGKNHPNWNGGSSFEPYSIDWTKTLKRSIRERDHYTCQVCGKEPATSVHHIDYNKKNSNPDNLVTLCRSCHTKTNYNRNNWIKYFHEK